MREATDTEPSPQRLWRTVGGQLHVRAERELGARLPRRLQGDAEGMAEAGPTPPSPPRVIEQLLGGGLRPHTVGLQTQGRQAPRGPQCRNSPGSTVASRRSLFLGWGDFMEKLVPRRIFQRECE